MTSTRYDREFAPMRKSSSPEQPTAHKPCRGYPAWAAGILANVRNRRLR